MKSKKNPIDFKNLSEKELIKILDRGNLKEEEMKKLIEAMEAKGMSGSILEVGDDLGRDGEMAVIEYIEYHKKLAKKPEKDEVIRKAIHVLADNDSTLEEKKVAIINLAHTGRKDACRALEKYGEKAEPELSIWVSMALDECLMFLKSKTLKKPIIEMGKVRK